MGWQGVVEGLLRWLHVLAGIAWIGHLYFFNWVNAQFAPTMDGETKKKVVPELMPRALWWFRWGAAGTWVTGLLLAGLAFYMTGALWMDGIRNWTLPTLVMVAVSWLTFFVYDPVAKAVKDQRVMVAAGAVWTALIYFAAGAWPLWSFRGAAIHVGIMFGTLMAANVWFRIWPAQKVIIAAVKSGQAPDAALVGLAGTRSKHNTYMSFPLVLAMLGQHETWAASWNGWLFVAMVLVAWALAFHLFGLSKKVKGF